MANETILRNGLISKASSEVEGTLSAEALAVINASGTTQFTLPTTDGSPNQILVTNGSGTVTWANNTDVSSFITGITAESIFSLNDVSETSGTIGSNEVLQWNGSNFVGVPATDLGSTTLEGLTDTTADVSSGAGTGNFLRWDGSDWDHDTLAAADIAEGFVTQHESAIEITVSQVSDFDPSDYVTTTAGNANYVLSSAVGANNGVASLDSNGLVPSSQLPSYVDDVLEYANEASFPATGETGKLYVDLSNNSVHRWSGSAYIDISDYSTPGHTHVASDITDFDTEVDNQIAAASIGDLTDVDITSSAPSSNQVLAWNDTDSEFQPTNVSALSTSDAVSTLTDVTLTGLAAGEFLVSTGASSWANKTIAEAGLATSTQGGLADSAVQPADLTSYIQTTDSVTDLSDVTNIGSNGNLIVNSGGSLAGVSSIAHTYISDFDTEVNALIGAADISDLSNTSITQLDEVSSVGTNGQILVSNGTNLVATTAKFYEANSTSPGTDAATSCITENLVGGYAAVTVEYSLKDGSDNMRVGQIMAITDGSTVEMTDISTAAIGSESDEPVFSATTSGANIEIKVSDASGYTVKTAHFVVNA